MWIILNNQFASPFMNIRAHFCTHFCRRDRPNFRLIGYYWNYDSRLALEPRVTVDEYRVTLQLCILFPRDKFWYFCRAEILIPISFIPEMRNVDCNIFCNVFVNFFGICYDWMLFNFKISFNLDYSSVTRSNFPKHTHHFTAIWVFRVNFVL